MGQAIILERTVRFDAAHHLPCMPDGHKCRRPHGHTYVLTVWVQGEVDRATGIVIDFGELDDILQRHVVRQWDHRDLNTILANPTGERMVLDLVAQLPIHLPNGITLIRVRLQEGTNNATIWTPRLSELV